MDFLWTESQLAFREKVIEFARSELNDDMAERDRHGAFSRQLWQKCADFGLQGLSMPTEYGGAGVDMMTAVLGLEGLGYGCRDNGLTFGLNAQMWTVQLSILNFGSPAQKDQYLPGLCSGQLIGAHGITEAEAGSDAYSLKTRAERVEGGYVLNGGKRLVTFAPIADLALVFATSDPSLGNWGISAFVVERGTEGFFTSQVTEKMGLRTVPMGQIELRDCFVPEGNRLGPEGAGVGISNSSFEWERSGILASRLGTMERQLEECVEFARKRQQFGQAIGKFQAVSHRLADMKVRLEMARTFLYKVAWLKQQGKSAMLEAAALKLYLSEAFTASSLDAIRIHGGNGYLTEFEIERDLRDAVGDVIYGGTSDIQRNIIAGLMGL